MESTIRPILEKITNMTREERRNELDAWIKAQDPNATIEADKATKDGKVFDGDTQEEEIEICPHSIKSKSYKENGYPIEVVMDNATIPTNSKKV